MPDLGSVRAIGLESGKPDPHAGALRSILDIEIMHIIDHQFSEEVRLCLGVNAISREIVLQSRRPSCLPRLPESAHGFTLVIRGL